MPKQKKTKDASTSSAQEKNELEKTDEENDIMINEEESSLTEFVRRPLPTEEQVERFEEAIDEEVEEEKKEEEVDESLNEIYQDDNGEMVDVRKMDRKKRHGFFFWIFSFILTVGFIGGAAYAAYYFYEKSGSDATAVDFLIEGKTEVIAGEDFFYTIKYKNNSNVSLRDIRVSVAYPDFFIYSDSDPEPDDKNSVWDIPLLGAKQSGEIKVKGSLIAEEDKVGIINASMTYTPDNFSSEFKKESTLTTVINNIGLGIDLDYINTALVGEEDEILIRFEAQDKSYIKNFRLSIEPQENLEIFTAKQSDDDKKANFTEIRPGVWQIDEVVEEEKVLTIGYKFTEKIDPTQDVVLSFEQVDGENNFYKFLEKKITFDVMESDLNLNLIVNGSRNDQGVDFGDTLNYSIVYANRGESEMKDVVIMAVLESDFLDWGSLADANDGIVKKNTITWTKEEIEELGALERNKEGTIDFSIKLKNIKEVDSSKEYKINSYAQFSVGKSDSEENKENNRSNVIVNKINSDLKLKEAVRYFDENNIPVGTGPYIPKVGETTSYKVYWDLENSLHELDDLVISVKLPDYVDWDEKNRASVGSVEYQSDTRQVFWRIGRLPITVYTASAEFSIKITPTEADRNTIMVLLPGSSATAVDAETKAGIEVKTKAQTTKLPDDEIANSDGVVE